MRHTERQETAEILRHIAEAVFKAKPKTCKPHFNCSYYNTVDEGGDLLIIDNRRSTVARLWIKEQILYIEDDVCENEFIRSSNKKSILSQSTNPAIIQLLKQTRKTTRKLPGAYSLSDPKTLEIVIERIIGQL